ncbi:VCBS repeat-containing protein [Candidatus Poribacteria bacterium]|nr:VCBS repeat-containing protein [Candidatus Poribacteria bacterium]
MGAISFDYDSDGLLDIYIAKWGSTTPFPNFLYRNEGNFRFKEIAAQAGLDKPEFAQGLALGDYDNDGDLDIFIASPGPGGEPQGIDVLYRNEGGGAFSDVAQQAGVQRKSNSVYGFFWDYDNDGDLDLFVQDLHFTDADAFNTLYRNNGDGTFTDVTLQAGIVPIDQTSWGAYYGDYDNDGWLDLCITYENTPTLLYHNNGDGAFTEVSKETGIGGINSGAVNFVDYDNDGNLDIFTGRRIGFKESFYRNDGTANHWLKLKLVGAKSNRDAIGARVKVKAGVLSMLREIAGGSGRGSHQHRVPLHFGLGTNPQADVIEIRWPSGIIQTLTNIPANQRLTIHELEGVLVVVHNAFPAFGAPTGGTPVRIQGEGFSPGSRVTFGGVEAREVRVESPSLIIALTPPGGTGLVDVAVIGTDGRRGALKDGFRYTTLKLIRITPESGPVTGGVTIQMEGFGFQPGTQALIGGKPLTNLFVTPTLIRGTVPAGGPGVVDVSVTNPDGERDVLRRAFTYISPPLIERISTPAFAPLAGRGEITIEGSGFIRTPTVQIGGITAPSVEFISATELNARTPPGLALGPQDVVVVNPDGQRALLPGGVTVLAPIKLKSVEPISGGLAGGTRITIVGEPTVESGGRTYPSRFVEGVEVFIGGEEVTRGVTVEFDHIITAITPSNTPGPKEVEVVNPDGSVDTLDNAFTYNPLPQILRVTPNNGRLAGGTKVTIQGADSSPVPESSSLITGRTPFPKPPMFRSNPRLASPPSPPKFPPSRER